MGEQITLKSPFDGFELSAYHARPTDARRGGLLLIQEIFGVTEHIRELADAFAVLGLEEIARLRFGRHIGEPAHQRDPACAAVNGCRQPRAAVVTLDLSPLRLVIHRHDGVDDRT